MRESTLKSPLVNQNVTGFRQPLVHQAFRRVGESPPPLYGVASSRTGRRARLPAAPLVSWLEPLPHSVAGFLHRSGSLL